MRLRRQLRRTLEQGGGRGTTTALLGPTRRAFKVAGDVLIRSRGRRGTMPGAVVGIGLGIGHIGERPMHVATVAELRRALGV